jgi:protein-S-isoprenylcysteine O-methyltransferase Ste14
MYAGVLFLFLVTIIGHLSPFTAAIGILVLIVLPWRINLEESQLMATYPDYAAYASGTKRLIPFVY